MSRKRYTEEFKKEAIELVASIGVTKASAELGVTPKTLRTWSEGNVESKSSGKKVSELEAELRALKKENRNLRIINDVLKKSTAIFSKDEIGD